MGEGSQVREVFELCARSYGAGEGEVGWLMVKEREKLWLGL